MSFAATKELKAWVEQTAGKRAQRVSSFIATILEKEREQTDVENIETQK